jgi:cyclophilin family peptidyl-prolyl cis-trans isomerase
MYAIFETSQGNIVVKLLEKEAPKTVENFIGLAEGTKEFTDESTGKKLKKNFYDGLGFHRVIPQFMIQGGCPQGTGRGGSSFLESLQGRQTFDGQLRAGHERQPIFYYSSCDALARQQAHHLWGSDRRTRRGE